MSVGSVSGSSQPDSSAIGWIESTIAAAESYAREANAEVWQERTDGVDDAPKSAPERALDAFWANDPNRPSSSLPGADTGSAGNQSSGNGAGGNSASPGPSTDGTGGSSSGSSGDGGSSGQGSSSTSPSPAPSGNPPPTHVINNGGQSITQTSITSIKITEKAPPPPVILPSLADPYNGAPPPPPQPQQPTSNPPGGIQEPQDAGAPDAPKQPEKIVSGAGARIDEMLNKSPSLRQMWEEAKARGWEIKFRDKGRSEADPNTTTVWINRNDIKDVANFEKHMASLLSHEIGHAGTPFKDKIQGVNEEDHVQRNTAKDLAHEGSAAFHNARTRDEIMGNGGPDIGIRGGFDKEYIRIYEDYKAGRISESEAISQMSYFMALEPMATEGGRDLTKQEVLERQYRDDWAKSHPPTN